MKLLGYAAILFFSNVLGSLAGFGAGLLSMPFLTQMFEPKMIIMVSTMTCILNVYIAVSEKKHIWWRGLGKILILMCLGLPAGILLLKFLPVPVIKLSLGILMVLIGVYGLAKMNSPRLAAYRFGKWSLRLFLILGGLIQGAVSGGGCFLILYAQQEIQGKQAFRATLAVVWTAISVLAVVQYAAAGMLTGQCFTYSLLGAPAVLAGIFAGSVISRKVSQRTFMYAVNLLLIAAGAVSTVSQLLQ